MVNIFIKTDSHYRINRKRVRESIKRYLSDRKVRGKVEVSLNIVGDRMMRKLNQKYRHRDEVTDVLSFPLIDQKQKVPFVDAPDEVLRLGDIVISYPQVIESAVEEEKLVDDKVDELVEHGLRHLLGNQHE